MNGGLFVTLGKTDQETVVGTVRKPGGKRIRGTVRDPAWKP
mgnify:FL=1